MAETKSSSFVLRPKRRPFGWRYWLSLLLIISAIPIGHAIWSSHEQHILQARIDALHAAGELVIPDDFAREEFTATQAPGNAAADLTAAATILDDDTVYASSVDFVSSTQPVAPEAWPYFTAAVEWFEPALRRVDRAEAKPYCQWSHSFHSPVMHHLLLPELNQCRAIARLLTTSAQVEHHQGHDAVVVRRLQQLMYVARVCDLSPTWVSHLVSVGIDATACRLAESLGPDLRIGGEDGAAEPEKVRLLIRDLLDESSITAGLKRACRADRMQSLDLIDSFVVEEAGFWPAADRYCLRPILCESEVNRLDQFSAISAAVLGSDDWPTTNTKLTTVAPAKGFLAEIDSKTSVPREILTHYRVLTDRRLAAVALAIRLFVVEHGGRWPRDLAELVPQYLPAVPVDPMATGGKPLGYLPRSEHPVLYSVGADGVDQVASEAAIPGAHGFLDEWGRLDRVFYLSLKPRADLNVPWPDEGRGGIVAEGVPYDTRTPWERHDPLTPAWSPPTTQEMDAASSYPMPVPR
jgi:hypothetical protein